MTLFERSGKTRYVPVRKPLHHRNQEGYLQMEKLDCRDATQHKPVGSEIKYTKEQLALYSLRTNADTIRVDELVRNGRQTPTPVAEQPSQPEQPKGE